MGAQTNLSILPVRARCWRRSAPTAYGEQNDRHARSFQTAMRTEGSHGGKTILVSVRTVPLALRPWAAREMIPTWLIPI